MPEFYRGGSRSPYGAQWWTGSLRVATAGSSTTIVTAAALAKIKRMQVVCMLPKTATDVDAGYMAFYRELPDTTTSVSGLSITNPQVLRPKPFVTNPDHAIYLEMYIEAITLDVGEKLHLFCDIAGGGDVIVIACSAKWYVDRQLHV